MKQKLLILVTLGLVALGCGGSGGGTPAGPSPFAGTWAGTFAIPSLGDSGTSNITIASDGTVAGTGHNTTENLDFNINGSITSPGTVSVTISGGATGAGSGTWAIAQNGNLGGSLNVTKSSGQGYTANYTFMKQ